jgi:hypothetical protein
MSLRIFLRSSIARVSTVSPSASNALFSLRYSNVVWSKCVMTCRATLAASTAKLCDVVPAAGPASGKVDDTQTALESSV